MYATGSLNSSSVGRKVGASGMPWGRTRFVGSRGALGWPRRSTVDKSRGADLRALKGTLWECDGWVLEDRAGWRPIDDCPAIEFVPLEAGATITEGLLIVYETGGGVEAASARRVECRGEGHCRHIGRATGTGHKGGRVCDKGRKKSKRREFRGEGRGKDEMRKR